MNPYWTPLRTGLLVRERLTGEMLSNPVQHAFPFLSHGEGGCHGRNPHSWCSSYASERSLNQHHRQNVLRNNIGSPASRARACGQSVTNLPRGHTQRKPRLNLDTKNGTDCVPKCCAHRFLPCRALSASAPSLTCALVRAHSEVSTPSTFHSNLLEQLTRLLPCSAVLPANFQHLPQRSILRSQQPEKILGPRHHLCYSLLKFFPAHVAQFFPRDSLAV